MFRLTRRALGHSGRNRASTPQFTGVLFTLLRYAVRTFRFLEGGEQAMLLNAVGELGDTTGAQYMLVPCIDSVYDMNGFEVAAAFQGLCRGAVADEKVRQHFVKNYIRKQQYTLISLSMMIDGLTSLRGNPVHPDGDLASAMELLYMAVDRVKPPLSSFSRCIDFAMSVELAPLPSAAGENLPGCSPVAVKAALRLLIRGAWCGGSPSHNFVAKMLLPVLQAATLSELSQICHAVTLLNSEAQEAYTNFLQDRLLTAEAELSQSLAVEELSLFLRLFSLVGKTNKTDTEKDDLVRTRTTLLYCASQQLQTASNIAMMCRFFKSLVDMEVLEADVVLPFLNRTWGMLQEGMLVDDIEGGVFLLEPLVALAKVDSKLDADSLRSGLEALPLTGLGITGTASLRSVLTMFISKVLQYIDIAMKESFVETHSILRLVTVLNEVEQWNPHCLKYSIRVRLDELMRTCHKQLSISECIAVFAQLVQFVPHRRGTALIGDRIAGTGKQLSAQGGSGGVGTLLRALSRYPLSNYILHQLAPYLAKMVTDMKPSDSVCLLALIATQFGAEIRQGLNPLPNTELLMLLKQFVLLHLPELSPSQAIACIISTGHLRFGHTELLTDEASEVVGAATTLRVTDEEIISREGCTVVLDLNFFRRIHQALEKIVPSAHAELLPSLLTAYLSVLDSDMRSKTIVLLLNRIAGDCDILADVVAQKAGPSTSAKMVNQLVALIKYLSAEDDGFPHQTLGDVCRFHGVYHSGLAHALQRLVSHAAANYPMLSAEEVVQLFEDVTFLAQWGQLFLSSSEGTSCSSTNVRLGDAGSGAFAGGGGALAGGGGALAAGGGGSANRGGNKELFSALTLHAVSLGHRWSPATVFAALEVAYNNRQHLLAEDAKENERRFLKCLVLLASKYAPKKAIGSAVFSDEHIASLRDEVLPALRAHGLEEGHTLQRLLLEGSL